MASDEVAVPFYLKPGFLIVVLAAPAVIAFVVYQVYTSSVLPLKDGDYGCRPVATTADGSLPSLTTYGDDLGATVEGGEVTALWDFVIDVSNPNASHKEDVDFSEVEQQERNRFTVAADSPISNSPGRYECKHGGWD